MTELITHRNIKRNSQNWIQSRIGKNVKNSKKEVRNNKKLNTMTRKKSTILNKSCRQQ